METKVTLFGASGHCKVIIDILHTNRVTVALIVDDNPLTTCIVGQKVVHSSAVDFNHLNPLILSIGNNSTRKMLSEKFKGPFARAIHSKAIVSNYATIGEGTVIMAGAIVNPDATIGKHCIINTGAVIEHDCIIRDFAHISPNAALAGGVEVGEGSQIGIGASVIQGIKIGNWVTIGAGTVLVKDVPDFAVVVGIPGKIIKYNKEND
ncbi:acetyltransferase [Flavobacterium psychrotolerans]|uniref:Acetyltransferase n=1 Tax=Flavobacterium psychrotolerans TaxID=2169410 RepID=A0A2U1JGG7_9FLAO|nr:acetyltransferase [Flavobacterium psychrotolerans]PWA04028.1 acetyltransferase [Flavobacterium psychrotolerans]